MKFALSQSNWALDPYYVTGIVKNEVAEFAPTIWNSQAAQHITCVLAHMPLKGTVTVRVVYGGPAAYGEEPIASIHFDASGKIDECILLWDDVVIHGHVSAHVGRDVSVMFSGSFPKNCRAFVDYEYDKSDIPLGPLGQVPKAPKAPEVSDKLPDSIHSTRREVE